jgi:uncharacterized protein (TIGR02001 family)
MPFHRPTDTHQPARGQHSRQRLLGLALTLALQQAGAQTAVSGSVNLLSDYRYRGISLSDGKAAYQLTVNLDHASGWYAGGFATSATVADSNGAQLIAYGGYAQRLRGGASWEAGCTRSTYTNWHVADYNECYAGLSGERTSARLSLSPRYLGRDNRTLYAELNSFYPLLEQVNLTGHAGLLRTLSGGAAPGLPPHQRYDARIGISVRLGGDWNAQLARTFAQTDSQPSYLPGSLYGQPSAPPAPVPARDTRPAQAWILGASYTF